MLVGREELLPGRVQSYHLCNPSTSLRASSPRAPSVLVERLVLSLVRRWHRRDWPDLPSPCPGAPLQRLAPLKMEPGVCRDLPGSDGAVALLQDEYCFYNGKTHWEASGLGGSAAGCFVPFAVCVVSRFPYYNALKDCLSW